MRAPLTAAGGGCRVSAIGTRDSDKRTDATVNSSKLPIGDTFSNSCPMARPASDTVM